MDNIFCLSGIQIGDLNDSYGGLIAQFRTSGIRVKRNFEVLIVRNLPRIYFKTVIRRANVVATSTIALDALEYGPTRDR